MEWWLGYAAIGAAVGFFAGLLGIGGGAIIVPLLVMLFEAQGLPKAQMPDAATLRTYGPNVVLMSEARR